MALRWGTTVVHGLLLSPGIYMMFSSCCCCCCFCVVGCDTLEGDFFFDECMRASNVRSLHSFIMPKRTLEQSSLVVGVQIINFPRLNCCWGFYIVPSFTRFGAGGRCSWYYAYRGVPAASRDITRGVSAFVFLPSFEQCNRNSSQSMINQLVLYCR